MTFRLAHLVVFDWLDRIFARPPAANGADPRILR
jgi:hypothetical protein